MMNDVTEAKTINLALLAHDTLLTGACNVMPEGIALYDPEERLAYCNPQFKRFFHMVSDLLVPGTPFAHIMLAAAERGLIPEAGADIEAWLLQRLQLRLEPQSDSLKLLKNGTVMQISDRRLDNGYMLSVSKDVTEFVQATQAAQLADQAKSAFLSTMSHEIRTPMNAIIGLLELLKLTELSQQQRDYLGKSHQAAYSMLQLLNDVLDISRLEAEMPMLELQPFAIDDLMAEFSTLLSAQRDEKPIELLFDVDPQLPKVMLGDVLRLKQILFNLGNNAVKFTHKGEVLVQLRVMSRSRERIVLGVTVQDTGIGISPEHHQHIFKAFSQAETSISRRFGGTGLGLAISQKLVNLMDGQIELHSEPGQGSTFTLRIPLRLPEAPLMDLRSPDSTAPEALRVLLVEDHPQARQLQLAMAQSLGWQTDTASSGEQALAMVQACSGAGLAPYQVIVLDEELGGMSGWQLVQRIREFNAAEQQPQIIMLFTQPRQSLSQRQEVDFSMLNAYLIKPITASMLAQAQSVSLDQGHDFADAATPGRNGRLPGLRFLVVEDNLLNQRVMQDLLHSEGAQAVIADNGAQAIRAIIDSPVPFDAVLMDLQMPVMDGFSATRVIREELAMPNLPILALSANVSAADRQACLASGFNAHLGKPFQMAELVKTLLHLTGHDAQADRVTLEPPPASAANADEDLLDGQALERLGSEPSQLQALLDAYLQEIVGQPDALEALLHKQDRVGARQLVHTLIGISGIVGAHQLARVSRQLEMQLQKPPMEAEDAAHCHDFRRAVVTTAQALRARMAVRSGTLDSSG
jgi:signal transduction histidine kinase/CheY-like chemotaxis protein